jgi:hypothetical protein
MQIAQVQRIEQAVDRAAATVFGAACAFAAYRWLALDVAQPLLGAETGAAAALAYVCAGRALGAVNASPATHPVPVFDLRDYESFGEPELLLDERCEAPAELADEPLVLDDVLAQPEPDSRVVRLFDPAAMPTPAELKSRIDRHLVSDASAAQSADATQALHDALAELRRSIR